MRVPSNRGDQTIFPEFLVGVVERFRYAVCIDNESVPGAQPALFYCAIPVPEQSQDGARRLEPLQASIRPQQQRRKMAAVDVPQPPAAVVVFGKKERGIGGFTGVLAKDLVYGEQQIAECRPRHLAMNAQVRL